MRPYDYYSVSFRSAQNFRKNSVSTKKEDDKMMSAKFQKHFQFKLYNMLKPDVFGQRTLHILSYIRLFFLFLGPKFLQFRKKLKFYF